MPKKKTTPATIYAAPIEWAAGLYNVQTGETYLFSELFMLIDAESTNGILINDGPLFEPAYLETRTRLVLGRTELAAVNEQGLIPITSYSIGEFCHLAAQAYGGYRPAAAKLSAAYGNEFCHEFIRNHAQKWKRQQMYGKPEKTKSPGKGGEQ